MEWSAGAVNHFTRLREIGNFICKHLILMIHLENKKSHRIRSGRKRGATPPRESSPLHDCHRALGLGQRRHIAPIPRAVAIRIQLERVRVGDAVVARVAHAIAIRGSRNTQEMLV